LEVGDGRIGIGINCELVSTKC